MLTGSSPDYLAVLVLVSCTGRHAPVPKLCSDSCMHTFEMSVIFYPQSLHAMESHVMIKFLPTTLNQLFRVLTSATQEEVAVNVTRQVSPGRSLFLTLYSNDVM